MTRPTPPDSLLPPNGVLLHIGPHKTGTTALQSALVTSAASLAEVGVLVPEAQLVYLGATALTGWTRGGKAPGRKPPIREWEQLDQWVREHSQTKLALSSEWFDDCTQDMITTIRDSWGQDRLRVMITIRPLERLLPSTWQQAVKTGSRYSYETFLEPLLMGPHVQGSKRASRFWHRHDHAALVERWAGIVGIDNLVVVVADEREPAHLYRHAEVLLGAPEGTITPGGPSNRSMTLPEIVAVRAMYREVLPADNAHQLHKWLQRGAVKHLVETRVPPKEEPRLQTPATAVARIREINHEIVGRLVATGVSILGDVSVLVPNRPIPADSETTDPVLVDPEVAALLVAGLYRAAAKHAANAEERIASLSATPSPPISTRARAGRWFRRRPRR